MTAGYQPKQSHQSSIDFKHCCVSATMNSYEHTEQIAQLHRTAQLL